MMKLAEKGRFAPPPKLARHPQRVSDEVAGWPEVHARSHWQLGDEKVVDGADFYVGQDELGHIHLDGEAHVMFPRPVADAIVKKKIAERLPWARTGTVVAIESAADAERALWLFRLSYEHRRGVAAAELLARVDEYGVTA